MLIQILVTGLAAFAIGRTFARFRRSEAGRAEFFLWVLFWIAAIVFVWNPSVTNTLASLLGVGRGADAIFYVSLILLFSVVFKLYGRIETLEHKLSELVKAIALKNFGEARGKQDRQDKD